VKYLYAVLKERCHFTGTAIASLKAEAEAEAVACNRFLKIKEAWGGGQIND